MAIWTRALFSAIGSLLAVAVMAQSWPSKPIRVYVGYNAGTSPDLVGRITAAEMAKHIGQPLVVENRPGAAGNVANFAVMRAEPDGYTLLVGSQTSSHPMFDKSGGIVLGKDLTALGIVAATPIVLLARTSLGIRNFQDLVAYSKANPNKLNFGSTANHMDLIAAALKVKTGLSYTSIRYKGAPVAELLRGETDFFVGSLSGLEPHIQAGKIAPILFMAKVDAYPNAPYAVDLGLLNAPVRGNYGYAGPVGLSNDVVRRVNQAILAASKSPEVIDGLRKLGLESSYSTPEQHLQEYEAVLAQYAETARATNYAPQ